VLPYALAQGVVAAWGRRPDHGVRIIATDVKQGDRFSLGQYVRSGRPWADLVRGACQVLESEGLRLPGIDLVTASDLPQKKGLGSSGAFLTAVVKAILAAAGRPAPPAEVAQRVSRIEEEWAGVRCGTMDPYVAALGKPERPILLDCRSLTHKMLPWPVDAEVIAHDTGVERSLVHSPYNERREELDAGLVAVRRLRPDVRALRDMPLSQWAAFEDQVPEPARRRVRHVVTEIERVHRAADALRAGDAKTLGTILDEGHQSLAQDFEASTPEVDALAARIRAEPDVLGVRLQGAGWGGCLVVLRRTTAGS
jgi:galactokinase